MYGAMSQLLFLLDVEEQKGASFKIIVWGGGKAIFD